MAENFLQLNEQKTEVIIICMREKSRRLKDFLELHGIVAKPTVKNWGILFDSAFTLEKHVKLVNLASLSMTDVHSNPCRLVSCFCSKHCYRAMNEVREILPPDTSELASLDSNLLMGELSNSRC